MLRTTTWLDQVPWHVQSALQHAIGQREALERIRVQDLRDVEQQRAILVDVEHDLADLTLFADAIGRLIGDEDVRDERSNRVMNFGLSDSDILLELINNRIAGIILSVPGDGDLDNNSVINANDATLIRNLLVP